MPEPTTPTLEPLAWALVLTILIAIYVYRKGDPKNYIPKTNIRCHNCNDRGYRIINGQVDLCPCKDEDPDYEDEDAELDHFIVAEIIDEFEDDDE